MKKKGSKQTRSLVLSLAVIGGVIIAFIALIIVYQIKKAPRAEQTTATTVVSARQREQAPFTSAGEQGTDAKAYYSKNATVLRTVAANESKQVYTEKQVSAEFAARGFGENIRVNYTYNMDGSAVQAARADKASSRSHPQYTATFVSQSGEYWTISVVNHSITAYPVTYNLEHNRSAELILSESESITAYDSRENCFYDVIPKENVLCVKQIPAITAQALEQLTAQEIEKL